MYREHAKTRRGAAIEPSNTALARRYTRLRGSQAPQHPSLPRPLGVAGAELELQRWNLWHGLAIAEIAGTHPSQGRLALPLRTKAVVHACLQPQAAALHIAHHLWQGPAHARWGFAKTHIGAVAIDQDVIAHTIGESGQMQPAPAVLRL